MRININVTRAHQARRCARSINKTDAAAALT